MPFQSRHFLIKAIVSIMHFSLHVNQTVELKQMDIQQNKVLEDIFEAPW